MVGVRVTSLCVQAVMYATHRTKAHEINSEFMKAKDLFIGAGKNEVKNKRKIRRIKYRIKKCQDTESYAELRGDTTTSLPKFA